MATPDGHVTVGEIRGAYGVRGWVKLFSWTRPRTNLFSYEQFVDSAGRGWRLLEGREQGKLLVGRLEGVTDRDEALALHGTALMVPRTALPEPDDDEYYWSDLIGMTVTDLAGQVLGRVDDLMETGAHDVMVLVRPGGEELLVPFVPGAFVHEVDLAAGRIVVDWHDGDDD